MNNRIGDNLFHFGANEELLRALLEEGVKLVVIGGLAIAWHCPERQADDMDLLVEPTVENSARIAKTLTKLQIAGFSSTSFSKPGLQIPLKHIYYAELLTPQQEAPSFSEVEAKAVDAKLFNLPIRLASISTLIGMKKRAIQSATEQLEKHAKDIELLEKISS